MGASPFGAKKVSDRYVTPRREPAAPLSAEEESEVLALRSLAGLPLRQDGLRPFRAPHHSLSVPGLLGTLVAMCEKLKARLYNDSHTILASRACLGNTV